MAHEIFDDRFLSRHAPAWHNLGEVFPLEEELTLTEAFLRARLDYEVKKYRILAEDESGMWPVADAFKIGRGPQGKEKAPRFFGACTGRYVPLQNMEVAAIVDETLRGRYPVETCGALKDGALAFFTLRGGSYAVKGIDEIKSYYLGSVNHKPGNSNGLFYTPVRVVCWNTEQLARNVAEIKLTIPHKGDPQAMLNFGLKLVEGMVNSEDETKLLFEALASTRISLQDAQRIIERAFPSTAKPQSAGILDRFTEKQVEELTENPNTAGHIKAVARQMKKWQFTESRLIAFREAALEQYHAFEANTVSAIGSRASVLGGTAWAAYNAVTEVTTWRRGKTDESASEQLLFGDRALQATKGFEAAIKMVKIAPDSLFMN